MYIFFDLFDQIQATTFIFKKKILQAKKCIDSVCIFCIKKIFIQSETKHK